MLLLSNQLSKQIKFAFTDDTKEFESLVNKQSLLIVEYPNRLILNGRIFSLFHKNEYVIQIYRVIAISLTSEWYQSLGQHSKVSFEHVLLKFIPWLISKDLNSQNCYSILKDYESFRVNEEKVKTQSTGLRNIISLLKHGINSDLLNHKNTQYVLSLIKSTNISIEDERDTNTLTSFFASMPWLRGVLGEKDYLKLESPKRLMDSFSIVVSTTLLFILESKSKAKILIDNPNKMACSDNSINNIAVRNQHYCKNLVTTLGSLNIEGKPADDLTELILLDCIPDNRKEVFLDYWGKLHGSKMNYRDLITKNYFFTIPHIFSTASWTTHSQIEQILCSWICAWQTVQPYDVLKLKRNDFVVNKNQNEMPISIQINYYKGRSGRNQEPPILNARQIEARALLAYLDQLPNEQSLLFNQISTQPKPLSFSPVTIPARLLRLFNSPKIASIIAQNIEYRQSTLIFLNAFKAMASQCESSYSTWSHFQKIRSLDRSISTYRLNSINALPQLLFGLSYIKNSAVHAKTDRYRSEDLVNQNSHTSNTEKIHYLTDANKEWVNQNGRITRMVILDIEKNAYRPNIEAAKEKALNLALHTTIVQTMGNAINPDLININELGRINKYELDLDGVYYDSDAILVLDTLETVVNMLHYINEAERQQSLLIIHALIFFEQTVLPTVEWMYSIMLNQLSPRVVKEGQKTYQEIKKILPQLFFNELRAGVT